MSKHNPNAKKAVSALMNIRNIVEITIQSKSYIVAYVSFFHCTIIKWSSLLLQCIYEYSELQLRLLVDV